MSTATDTTLATPEALLAVLDDIADQTCLLETNDLTGLGADQLVEFARRFEASRNRLGRLDWLIAAACEASGAADRHSCGSTATLLSGALRISRGDALARVRAAENLLPSTTMTGESLPAKQPVLADAIADGTVGSDVVDIALRAMEKVERTPGATAEQVAIAEQALAEQAPSFGPREFGHLAQRVIDCVDSDGTLKDDQYHQGRRSVDLRQVRDGSFRLEGRLTPGLGEKLQALLSPLTKPQDGPDGPDQRQPDQRRHDALEMLADRLLRAGDLPESGGTPTTVVVTMTLEDLLGATGHGNYGDGTPVAIETVLRDAAQAEIIPVVLAANGEALDLGRTRRIANRAQTLALYVRDKGCSFPGCTVAPEWCERHHIVAWINGGATCLENLTLVCKYHHHNFERLRWSCTMIDGLPWWTPPGYIDPAQTPMINWRIARLGHHRSGEDQPRPR